MVTRRVGKGGWERAVPRLTEEGLLLAELSHRVANEVAAALAAMKLVQSGRGGRDWQDVVDAAAGRLEGFAGVLASLRIPPEGSYDLRRGLDGLVEGLCAWRGQSSGSIVSLDMAETIVDGDTARRVMMIAAELVQNAICHALENRRGTLGIVLRHDDREVRLAVIDDGPGIRAGAETRGSGMGRHIVAELVRRGGGELKCESGPRGTSIRVSMPRAVVARTAE